MQVCLFFLSFVASFSAFLFVTTSVYAELSEGDLILFLAQGLPSLLLLSALIYKVFPFLQPPLEGINEQKL